MDAQSIQFRIDVEQTCLAASAAFFTPKRAHECVVASFLFEQRFAFAHRTTSLLTFVGHVKKAFFGVLFGERTKRKTRDDAQVRVCAGEFVAGCQRFSMHDAGVHEQDVEVERFAVGESTKQRASALHAREDGRARAEDAVNEPQDFNGFRVREPLVEGIEGVRGDAHGGRASTSRDAG